ncbi:acetylxylan esterase [Methylocaldum szegediense]|uniref:Cephalosporin-C deacetylase n=1 Tax=Methylocaldum szegediense TaxID=73780 RepID=A0ABM9I498_9GAMM|nr:acetylxylan esterase [Methylocaldum szegediense]CAI8882779.1 cephalosporin-C deacetylase [Methylocaldum szegediense]
MISVKLPFDPTYGYTLESLLQVGCPEEPSDFVEFWEARYRRALSVDPSPELSRSKDDHPDFDVYAIRHRSTDDFVIGGWLVRPKRGPVRRGLVVGHGYGGREGPDFDLPVREAAVLFPCFRGLSASRDPRLPDDPARHVLHGIDQRDHYILGSCVEDLWLAVSVLLHIFPQVEGHIAYSGISFGGGIGALALPWEPRIQIAHLNVPTFGHQPLRLTLPTLGSGEAVRRYERRHGSVLETLRYYDAACAARHIRIPVHVAAALSDPFVAPPGQFAIYNALPGPKRLFVLKAGHSDYPERVEQERALLEELSAFFEPL